MVLFGILETDSRKQVTVIGLDKLSLLREDYAEAFRTLKAKCYIPFLQNGSVIRGWLVELMEKGLREQDYGKIPSYVEDTGEVNWLLEDAINKEIPIPVIAQSIMELFKSRSKDSDAYKSIALMRHGFGGHPFGTDEYIVKERKTDRIARI